MTEEETVVNAENPSKKKGRKKRKNFLSNAKKYGKKGQLGRGTKMTEELYQYFVGILEAMKKGIEDGDERQALVNNVLVRTKGDEINIAGNQLGCRVIELLLPLSSPDDLERYMEVLFPELRRLCSDNFTSHVIETLLRVSCERATETLQNVELVAENNDNEVPKKKKKKDLQTKSKYSKEHVQKCHDFTIRLCKYVLNNLEDFVWDSSANYILRSALKCLSGITLLPGEKPKINMFIISKTPSKGIAPHEKLQYKNIPQEFKDLVIEFANRLSSWPQFNDLPFKNMTSALLQVLLYALKNADKALTKDLVLRLLNESFAPDGWVGNSEGPDEKKEGKIDLDEEQEGDHVMQKPNLPPVFASESAVRLLEAAIFVAKKKTYTQIYAKCFINRLAQLSVMPMLNYTVQRLFDNCQIKEEFEPMFEELSDKYGAILASNNSGVLVAIAKACLRVQAKQAHFLANLESALKCCAPENQKYFPMLCLRLLPLDRVDLQALDKEYFINIHGSVILQTLLDFQRPGKAVSSLMELTADQLMVILCDAKGCHVADAFVKGQFVGVKSRDKLVWKLKGYYQKLALSQYGSRAFEQIYAACSLEQKVKIMTELADKSNLLNSTMYGKLIASKLNVELFKKSPDNWQKNIEKETGEVPKEKDKKNKRKTE